MLKIVVYPDCISKQFLLNDLISFTNLLKYGFHWRNICTILPLLFEENEDMNTCFSIVLIK